jgi:hypothetical protein
LIIVANSVNSFDAIDGLISDCPPATERMAAATSSIEISLSRYPLAPALIASYRSASSSEIVSITILALGTTSLMAVHASIPLRRGIRTSISTMSGSRADARSTASAPSLASPTTSMSVS